MASASRYDASVMRSIDALKSQIASESRQVFAAHRERLRRALQSEITGRFDGQNARYESSINGDPQIQTAIGLVRTGRRTYDRLLSAR
ncbi:MAG: hypothetical protein H7X80_06200 [bacterium]|nr:hypothetical protein [Candidatus Kapabacteria bacterium]